MPGARHRVVVRDDVAALLCPECQGVAEGLQPRLRAAGWQLADSRTADLDQETGQVVIPSPRVAINGAAVDAMPSDKSDGHLRPCPAATSNLGGSGVGHAVAGDEPAAEDGRSPGGVPVRLPAPIRPQGRVRARRAADGVDSAAGGGLGREPDPRRRHYRPDSQRSRPLSRRAATSS